MYLLVPQVCNKGIVTAMNIRNLSSYTYCFLSQSETSTSSGRFSLRWFLADLKNSIVINTVIIALMTNEVSIGRFKPIGAFIMYVVTVIVINTAGITAIQ